MSKRFGIDARWITPHVSGIGRYTERLICALSRIDAENEYFLFFSDPEVMKRVMSVIAGEAKQPRHFQAVLFPHGPFSLASLFKMPARIRRCRLDLFHSTNFMLPLFCRRVKCVATVHDLIPLLFPEMTPKAKKTRFYPVYALLMKWIARKADLILADSEHSRQDILRKLRLPPDKVRRVYVGIEERFTPGRNHLPGAYKKILGIAQPYFLYVGRHDPYKNILGLVQAYAQFLSVIERSPSSSVIASEAKQSQKIPQLVVTGKPDPRYPEALRWCEEKKLFGKVVFTDHVDDDELLSLYRNALGLVLASRYEGFGLPVLEAMACGVPVLCSDVASLPEVAGGAALLVSPDSTPALAAGLERLFTDEKLRRELSQKGLFQARKFSWEACGRETLQAYLDAVNHPVAAK